MSEGIYTEHEFKEAVVEMNNLVGKYSREGSALAGLTCIAMAFGAVCDIYAMPNPENPEGMCDSKEDFRAYFADILAIGPQVQKGTSA